jgi:hypothetical protein
LKAAGLQKTGRVFFVPDFFGVPAPRVANVHRWSALTCRCNLGLV